MKYSRWHSLRPSLPKRIMREIGYTIAGKNIVGEGIYGIILSLFMIVLIGVAGAIFA